MSLTLKSPLDEILSSKNNQKKNQNIIPKKRKTASIPVTTTPVAAQASTSKKKRGAEVSFETLLRLYSSTDKKATTASSTPIAKHNGTIKLLSDTIVFKLAEDSKKKRITVFPVCNKIPIQDYYYKADKKVLSFYQEGDVNGSDQRIPVFSITCDKVYYEKIRLLIESRKISQQFQQSQDGEEGTTTTTTSATATGSDQISGPKKKVVKRRHPTVNIPDTLVLSLDVNKRVKYQDVGHAAFSKSVVKVLNEKIEGDVVFFQNKCVIYCEKAMGNIEFEAQQISKVHVIPASEHTFFVFHFSTPVVDQDYESYPQLIFIVSNNRAVDGDNPISTSFKLSETYQDVCGIPWNPVYMLSPENLFGFFTQLLGRNSESLSVPSSFGYIKYQHIPGFPKCSTIGTQDKGKKIVEVVLSTDGIFFIKASGVDALPLDAIKSIRMLLHFHPSDKIDLFFHKTDAKIMKICGCNSNFLEYIIRFVKFNPQIGINLTSASIEKEKSKKRSNGVTCYSVFMKHFSEESKKNRQPEVEGEEHDSKWNFLKYSKDCSDAWGHMTEEEKKPFYERAEIEKAEKEAERKKKLELNGGIEESEEDDKITPEDEVPHGGGEEEEEEEEEPVVKD